MPEPYVPSGREFDQGTIRKKKPEGRLRRGLAKLTGRRQSTARVHTLRTHVPDGVGERLPGTRAVAEDESPSIGDSRSASAPSSTAGRASRKPSGSEPSTPSEKESAAPAKTTAPRRKKAAESSTKKTSAPRATQSASPTKGATRRTVPDLQSTAAQLGVEPTAFLTLLCADGDLHSPVLRGAVSSAVTDDTPPLVRAGVDWLLGVAGPKRDLAFPAPLSSELPAKAAKVFLFVWRIDGEDALGTYRRAMTEVKEHEKALRDLDRAAERYATLRPFAQELRQGRLASNWIQNLGGSTSAAFTDCSHEITAAVRAHDRRKRYADWPRWPDGVELGVVKSDPMVIWGVASRLTDSPKVMRVVRKVRRDVALAIGNDSARLDVLAQHGVRLEPPRKRVPRRGV